MAFNEMPPGAMAIPAARGETVQLGCVNNVHNSHKSGLGQVAVLEEQLRREVRNHLARCQYQRYAESRPHVSEMPSATDRRSRIQVWRADDQRDRFYEERA
jgi:hypothetical protein